ncbi:ABC transporter permease [Xylanimonas sp. McL0601]|uniref:ABC transporter permease n=1 Tax=Xylanimonas sp. McL0601 TaxID=3414739 RepID=UPI003CEE37BD
MLRLTLAQMRRSIGRLTAAGIAIVIGTAFVAASLLAGNLITRSAYDAISAQYAQADLVVEAPDGAALTAHEIDAIRTTPGVASAAGQIQSFQSLTAGGRTIYQGVIPTTPNGRLMPLTLTDGEWPTGENQIALPPDVAKRLGAGVGDTIGVDRWVKDGTETDRFTVTGLVDDPKNAYGMSGGAAVMDADALAARIQADGTDLTFTEAAVVLADGAALDDVRAALLQALPKSTEVVTPDEHAAATAQTMTGGEDVIFLVFVLTFAAIALLVAGLVITNTFQVLVAQRTRTLALLRAVGANKRQVGAGVLLEAALLGVVTSLVGVLVGCGLGQLALVVASNSKAAAFLPASIHLTWPVVLIPMLVGTAVTVLAALVPARNATRVAPLAALRPDDGPSLEKGSAGRVRLVLSSVAILGGFALLAGGAALGTVGESAQRGLIAGIAGGAISFVGVAVSAVFWLPRVASWAGRLVGLSGPTARLAAANTLRNPRRTAATSTALLIGVTLVAMMSTAAASARTSLTAQLDEQFPVDVLVEAVDDGSGSASVPADVVSAVDSAQGVASVARPVSGVVTIGGRYNDADGNIVVGKVPAGTPDDQLPSASLLGVDPASALAALNDASVVADLAPGTVVIPSELASVWKVDDGDAVTFDGPDGQTTLTAAVSDGAGVGSALVVPADLAAVDAHPDPSALWISLADGDVSAVATIQDAVADTGEPVAVQGAAVERASYEQVIDTALAIVVGLLAVAVVIALIGVANTLSLSVLERRRESATLRAIGVTRGQLRWMLAVEGMLIAGVGAVLGIVLGLAYGWAGSLAALGVVGPVELSVPWRDLALVAVVALVAGLVASVAPGRSAVRPSPVAALATE